MPIDFSAITIGMPRVGAAIVTSVWSIVGNPDMKYVQVLLRPIGRLAARYKGNYRQLFLMFLLVFLVPLGVAAVLSNVSTNALEHQLETSASAISAQIQTTIDKRLSDLSQIVDQINNHSSIRYILSRKFPLSSQDRYIVTTIIRDLRTQYSYHSMARNLYIFLPAIDAVITPQTKVNSKFYYEKYMTYLNKDYEQWMQEMLYPQNEMRILPSQHIRINDDTRKTITVLQSLPRGDTWNRTGTLAMLVDEAELLSELAFTGIVEGAEIWAVDSSGSIVFSTSGSTPEFAVENRLPRDSGTFVQEIDDKPYQVSWRESLVQDWIYVFRFPKSQFFSEAALLRKTILTTLILMLGVGILLAALLAYINILPVHSLLLTMQRFSGDAQRNEKRSNASLQFLGTVAEQVTRNNSILVDQLPRLIEGCIFKLIHGNIDVQSDLDLLREILGFSFPSSVFSVLSLRFDDMASGESQPKNTIAQMGERISRRQWHGLHVYTTQATVRSLAILVCFPLETPYCIEQNLRLTAQDILAEIHRSSVASCQLGVGAVVTSYEGISASYREAAIAIDSTQQKTEIIFFSDISDEPPLPDYCYTLIMEKALIGCVLTGDSSGTRGIIHDMFEGGKQRLAQSPDILQCLKFDLLGTIYRCIQEMRYSDTDEDQKQLSGLLHRWATSEVPEDIRKYATYAFEYLCAYASEPRRDKIKVDHLLQGVLSYIGENYSDPNMGLEKVADAFNIAPGYLSRYVKEKSGTNFLVILNNHRIQHAAALLKTTKMSHQEIAVACGLSSAQALNRLFARKLTVTPSEYRLASRSGIPELDPHN